MWAGICIIRSSSHAPMQLTLPQCGVTVSCSAWLRVICSTTAISSWGCGLTLRLLCHCCSSWFAAGGMANITPDQSSSCHGILHHVTAQEFEVLKEIESNYGTAELPVTPYTPCSSSSTSTTSSGSQQPPSATCHGISPVAPAHINTGDAHASNSSGPIVPGVPVTATAFIVSPERIAAMTQVRCHPWDPGSCPTFAPNRY